MWEVAPLWGRCEVLVLVWGCCEVLVLVWGCCEVLVLVGSTAFQMLTSEVLDVWILFIFL